MRVLATLVCDLIVDCDETCAAFAISEQTATPVDAVSTVRVATVDVTVVQELKVLLSTLLVARCFELVRAIELLDLFFNIKLVMIFL